MQFIKIIQLNYINGLFYLNFYITITQTKLKIIFQLHCLFIFFSCVYYANKNVQFFTIKLSCKKLNTSKL